jgi:hypothetical protein
MILLSSSFALSLRIVFADSEEGPRMEFEVSDEYKDYLELMSVMYNPEMVILTFNAMVTLIMNRTIEAGFQPESGDTFTINFTAPNGWHYSGNWTTLWNFTDQRWDFFIKGPFGYS